MAEPLEEVTVRPRAARPDVLRFGEMADQELDRILLNLQPDLNANALQTVDVVGQLDPVDTVEVRAQRALAQATPQQRGFLLGQVQQMVDFVAPQVERVLRLTGEVPAIMIERYGQDIVDMAADQVRAAEAAARAAAIAAERVLPEIVMTGARIGTGTPFGIATGIVQGAYELGSFLSDLALRGAIDRISPPPVFPSLPSPPAAEPAPERRPPSGTRGEPPSDVLLPPVTVTGVRPPRPLVPEFPGPTFVNPPLSFVTPGDLGAPGPLDQPVNLPAPAPRPLPAPAPAPLTLANPLTFAPPLSFPSPSSPPSSFGAPAPTPLGIPGPTWAGSPDARTPPTFNAPPPNRCDCGPGGKNQKKKRKKRKPREVCYRGTYYENARSLTKFRKEQIPCQRSKSK